jgi:hypothetical protein
MTDQRKELLGTLDELHDELAAAENVSPEVEAKLRETMDEIRGVLDADGESEGEAATSITGRLSEAAEQFETSHPTLSAMLGSAIDALGRMGI